MGDSFYDGEYLEGEEESSHSFTRLQPARYTVLIYGMEREMGSFSLPDGPDYVTVVNVNGFQDLPVPSFPSETLKPSMTICFDVNIIAAVAGLQLTSLHERLSSVIFF